MLPLNINTTLNIPQINTTFYCSNNPYYNFVNINKNVIDFANMNLTPTSTGMTIIIKFAMTTDPYIANVSLLLHGNVNSAGNFIDSSTNNQTITNGNAIISPTTTMNMFGNNSLYFNGNSPLKTPSSIINSFGTNNFTIEFWFNRTGANQIQRWICNYTSGSIPNFWVIGSDNYGANIRVWVNSIMLFTGTILLNTNTWYHYALVRNGNTFTQYINGIQDVQTTTNTSIPIDTGITTTNTIYMGTDGGNNIYTGYMAEIRITNGTARYTGNFTVPTYAFANTASFVNNETLLYIGPSVNADTTYTTYNANSIHIARNSGYLNNQNLCLCVNGSKTSSSYVNLGAPNYYPPNVSITSATTYILALRWSGNNTNFDSGNTLTYWLTANSNLVGITPTIIPASSANSPQDGKYQSILFGHNPSTTNPGYLTGNITYCYLYNYCLTNSQINNYFADSDVIYDGSCPSLAAISAVAIINACATSGRPPPTDGVYWINLPTVGPTQIYCLMNSNLTGGGGWMMAMKAIAGNTFQYNSPHWTTVTTLNQTDTTRNVGDSKFHTMNYYQGKQLLALWPDITTTGGSLGTNTTNNPYGCWSWQENYTSYYTMANGANSPQLNIQPMPMINFFNIGTNMSPYPIVANQNNSGTLVNQYTTQNYSTFSGWSSKYWTVEYSEANHSIPTYNHFYGFNFYGDGAQRYVRWGFGFNNEDNWASDDVSGGIGMNNPGYSAGDYNSCCAFSPGINRTARVEIYVR